MTSYSTRPPRSAEGGRRTRASPWGGRSVDLAVALEPAGLLLTAAPALQLAGRMASNGRALVRGGQAALGLRAGSGARSGSRTGPSGVAP